MRVRHRPVLLQTAEIGKLPLATPGAQLRHDFTDHVAALVVRMAGAAERLGLAHSPKWTTYESQTAQRMGYEVLDPTDARDAASLKVSAWLNELAATPEVRQLADFVKAHPDGSPLSLMQLSNETELGIDAHGLVFIETQVHDERRSEGGITSSLGIYSHPIGAPGYRHFLLKAFDPEKIQQAVAHAAGLLTKDPAQLERSLVKLGHETSYMIG